MKRGSAGSIGHGHAGPPSEQGPRSPPSLSANTSICTARSLRRTACEVFLDVWRQADRFEGRSAVSTWLMSIARFKALSARRGRKDAESDDKIEATIADPADDPAVTLEKKNQSELLRHALTKLSAEHREIIDLVYYHEQSVDDAAQVLGIPAATVKTRMFYARKKLGGWLKAAK